MYMSFLKAEWRKLIFANYEIDPHILKPYVPPKTELDTYEGKHFISLVGFMFQNVRLLGLKIPFHTHFEEVNLRFYVRYKEGSKWKRGTVFIKEFVPKAAITLVANNIYNERYETLSMSHHWSIGKEKQQIRYDWKKKGLKQHLQVSANSKAIPLPEGGEEEFITEHYWGYNKLNEASTNEYEVTHPRWKAYEVMDYDIKADFSHLYGPSFKVLNEQQPASILLMEGSEITIEQKRKL